MPTNGISTVLMKKRRKLDQLTKPEAEKKSKLRAEEEAERIDILGQPNEAKAVKWIKEVAKEEEKKEEEQRSISLDQLHSSRRRIFTYRDTLILAFFRLLNYWKDQLPRGYNWTCQLTKKGIVLIYRNKKGEYFARGLIVSGDPKSDLTGIERLTHKALSEIDKETTKKTKSGIILPS